MAGKVQVLDLSGKGTGEIAISDDIMKASVDPSLIHQVVRGYMAEHRQGSASTKTKGEVRGGGVKPWRQKGTGRARAGSIRSPLWNGGGTVFGPRPRSFSINVPKKAKKQALRNVVGDKVKSGSVKVVKDITWDKPKTKQAVKLMNALKLEGKVLMMIKDEKESVVRSFLNLPEVKIVSTDQLNVYDILDSDDILTTKKAFEALIEERLK